MFKYWDALAQDARGFVVEVFTLAVCCCILAITVVLSIWLAGGYEHTPPGPGPCHNGGIFQVYPSALDGSGQGHLLIVCRNGHHIWP